MVVARKGPISIVEYLLKSGCDVNMTNKVY